jgi:hypothetical protein
MLTWNPEAIDEAGGHGERRPAARFYRTGFAWRIVPALALLIVVSYLVKARPLTALTIVACAILLPFALVRSLQYIAIEPGKITIGTRFLTRSEIRKNELVYCRRIRFSGVTAVYVNVLQLADERLAGQWRSGLIISPYGWGRSRRELFTLLGRWLATCPADIGSDVPDFIARYAR